MTTFTRRILRNVKHVRGAMAYEPEIQPSFEHAGLATTLAIMFCLLEDGVVGAAAMHSYLAARGSKFDLETIESLFKAFDGQDRQHCLWTRLWDDEYLLNAA